MAGSGVKRFNLPAALSGDKRPEKREASTAPSPSAPRWGKRAVSGCWRGAGGWMGPASDLRQKECPRLLSRPAPLAALHTVISAEAFVFTFQTPNPRAEATDEHIATPRSPCCCSTGCMSLQVQPLPVRSGRRRVPAASHGVLPQSRMFPCSALPKC